MELHIWGPAFGLPSIDAECLATVAYLHKLLDTNQWTLIAGSDPSKSPTGEYPCLHHEGRTIAGYDAIVEYLESSSSSLDAELSPLQRANSTAIKAHLASNALGLIDANLYTSSTNYLSATRPAWSEILPHVAHSIFPAQRYRLSESRTSSTGPSASSVDDLQPSDFTPLQQQEARMISSSPSLLFRRRQTVQAALQAQQSIAKFRLDAMVEALVEPLDEMLGNKRYLVTDGSRPTTQDCVCFAYLALLLYPELPNMWIAETTRRKYPKVAKYVDRLRVDLFGAMTFNASDIMRTTSSTDADPPDLPNSLPWRARPLTDFTSSIGQMGSFATSNILESVLSLAPLSHNSTALTNTPSPTTLQPWYSPLNLFLVLTGPMLAGAAWLLYAQTHSDVTRDKYFGRPRPAMYSFGAAADVLSGLGSFRFEDNDTMAADGPSMQTREQDRGPPRETPGIVDVSVES